MLSTPMAIAATATCAIPVSRPLHSARGGRIARCRPSRPLDHRQGPSRRPHGRGCTTRRPTTTGRATKDMAPQSTARQSVSTARTRRTAEYPRVSDADGAGSDGTVVQRVVAVVRRRWSRLSLVQLAPQPQLPPQQPPPPPPRSGRATASEPAPAWTATRLISGMLARPSRSSGRRRQLRDRPSDGAARTRPSSRCSGIRREASAQAYARSTLI